MVELTSRQTAENLKEEVFSVLRLFGISINQIYATTTDNGANFLKTVALLKEIDDTISEDDDEAQNYDVPESLVMQILSSVRCVSHTLQLAVQDVIQCANASSKISEIRNAVKV